jgi:hypothetical protein
MDAENNRLAGILPSLCTTGRGRLQDLGLTIYRVNRPSYIEPSPQPVDAALPLPTSAAITRPRLSRALAAVSSARRL